MKMIRLAAALLMTVAATAAYAQQNNFDIKTDGTVTGNCHYTFDAAKGGFKITSHFINHVPPQLQSADAITGQAATLTTEVIRSSSYKLDANYNYAGGNVTNSDPALTFGYNPNKQRTQMQMSKMEGGNFDGSPTTVDLKPGFVLLPDLDASAIQSFLYLATAHPTADGNYFLILPTGLNIKGSDASATALNVGVHWTAQSDATGTLSGKAVTLHHFAFAYGKTTIDVYGDETNTLMEADAVTGASTTSYVRSGFAMDAPK
jgi:hypothetical protein